MNIFALMEPDKAARMMADKHIPKMIVESVQMLVQTTPGNGAPAERTAHQDQAGAAPWGYRAHPARWGWPIAGQLDVASLPCRGTV